MARLGRPWGQLTTYSQALSRQITNSLTKVFVRQTICYPKSFEGANIRMRASLRVSHCQELERIHGPGMCLLLDNTSGNQWTLDQPAMHVKNRNDLLAYLTYCKLNMLKIG